MKLTNYIQGKAKSGLALIEYTLIGALVAVASIAILTSLGDQISETMGYIVTELADSSN